MEFFFKHRPLTTDRLNKIEYKERRRLQNLPKRIQRQNVNYKNIFANSEQVISDDGDNSNSDSGEDFVPDDSSLRTTRNYQKYFATLLEADRFNLSSAGLAAIINAVLLDHGLIDGHNMHFITTEHKITYQRKQLR